MFPKYNAPYNPVRFINENVLQSTCSMRLQLLIVCLIVRKYGIQTETYIFINDKKLFSILLIPVHILGRKTSVIKSDLKKGGID